MCPEHRDAPASPRARRRLRHAIFLGAATAGSCQRRYRRVRISPPVKKQAEESELQLMSGGIVVGVRTRNPEKETQAQAILAKFGGEAIRLHEIESEKHPDGLPLSKLKLDP